VSEPMSAERLAEIRARCEAATPGPWYPRATDDCCAMNARYVGLRETPSTVECELYPVLTKHFEPGEWGHDGRYGLDVNHADHEPPDQVVAITLLQQPDLVGPGACDENTAFIAAARQDIPDLLAEVERLREELERLRAERRWVPVGERLPDDERLPADDSPVLVLCHIDGHEPWVEVRASCDLPSYATHWQPLPPLPEDAE
jgi:hypothetical protein